MPHSIHPVEHAITELKQGNLIIVTDDENRENEGDLLGIGEIITPENINFMIRFGRGLVCSPISSDIARRLHLTPLKNNLNGIMCNFTIAVDAKGTGTGISAAARAQTIRTIAQKDSQASDFDTPGHMFPLIAKDGGVLQRPGHTEAAVDLAKLAGYQSAGVICEIINDDGTMARMPDLIKYGKKWNMPIITIEQLIAYRRETENI